jgi:hypothetical protein
MGSKPVHRKYPRHKPLNMREPPFCRGLCFPGRAVRSAQIGLSRKPLAGCSLTVGVVTSCWKVASLNSRSPRWLGAGAG